MGVTHVLTSHTRTAWASQALTVIDGAASDPDVLRMVAWERGREKDGEGGRGSGPGFWGDSAILNRTGQRYLFRYELVTRPAEQRRR